MFFSRKKNRRAEPYEFDIAEFEMSAWVKEQRLKYKCKLLQHNINSKERERQAFLEVIGLLQEHVRMNEGGSELIATCASILRLHQLEEVEKYIEFNKGEQL